MRTSLITTPVGSFGKGVKGSITLNFSTSGGSTCDDSCRHHPTTTAPAVEATRACYAVTVGKLKPSVTKNLERKEAAGFAATCEAMRLELLKRVARGDSFPWVRLSAFGSVPQPITLTPADKQAFAGLLSVLARIDTDVHFPVESLSKIMAYGDIAARAGIITRLSLQAEAALSNPTTRDLPVSWVAGKRGMTYAQKVVACKEAKRKRKNATGRKTVICPAVLATLSRKGKNIKCGECTACAHANTDIIYPLH